MYVYFFYTASYFSEELLESENNRGVENVANKASTLKNVNASLCVHKMRWISGTFAGLPLTPLVL